MRYLLTIYDDESTWNDVTPEQSAQVMAAYGAFGEAAQSAGVLLGGEGLQPTSTATTVRVRDGEALTTDGPFAETREQLGGYYLLDCKDLDDAIRGRRRSRAPRTARSKCARSWTTRRWAAKRPTRRPRAWRSTLSAPGVIIDRLFRRESGQAVAALARAFGDLDRAEEAVQDAFVVALERWPRDGVPPNPAAWIALTARRRAIDRLRREKRESALTDPALSRLQALGGEDSMSTIPDERLELIFACCTRRSRRSRGSRLRCGRSAASPRVRWRARSSCPRTRWHSGSSAPSASCATPASASSSRGRRISPRAARRCSRRCT